MSTPDDDKEPLKGVHFRVYSNSTVEIIGNVTTKRQVIFTVTNGGTPVFYFGRAGNPLHDDLVVKFDTQIEWD